METQTTQHNTKRPWTIGLAVGAALLLFAIIAMLGYRFYMRMEYQSYKMVYPEWIQAYAKEYALDPYLVAAVIDVESDNRVQVASHKGAIGLMQIMPDTGEWIAGHLGEAYDEQRLRDPETNIRYGCWYLRFLMDRFSGVEPVLAAYNAGQGNVRNWLQDASTSSDGRTLSHIPFPETAEYVERVLHSYERYQTLYPDVFGS